MVKKILIFVSLGLACLLTVPTVITIIYSVLFSESFPLGELLSILLSLAIGALSLPLTHLRFQKYLSEAEERYNIIFQNQESDLIDKNYRRLGYKYHSLFVLFFVITPIIFISNKLFIFTIISFIVGLIVRDSYSYNNKEYQQYLYQISKPVLVNETEE